MPTKCLNSDVDRILPVFIPFHSILQARCYAYQVTRRRCIFSEFLLLKRTLMRRKQKLAWATSWDALQNISVGTSDPSCHTWSPACGNHYVILHPSNYLILVYEAWLPWAGKWEIAYERGWNDLCTPKKYYASGDARDFRRISLRIQHRSRKRWWMHAFETT